MSAHVWLCEWDISLNRNRFRFYRALGRLKKELKLEGQMSTMSVLITRDEELARRVFYLASEFTPRVHLYKAEEVTRVTEKKDNNWGGSDARDAIPPNSSKPLVSLDDLKSVHWDAQFYDEHECAICGYKKLTSWKAELFKGPDVPICEDCKQEWERKREVTS